MISACEYIHLQHEYAIIAQWYEDRQPCSFVIGLERALCHFDANTSRDLAFQQNDRELAECNSGGGCAGDYTGDGEVDVDDILEAVNHWQLVGTDGLSQIINNWGACE